eukprot:m51a1_g1414 hypothetical protein (1801) ;mRNA; r:26298-32451
MSESRSRARSEALPARRRLSRAGPWPPAPPAPPRTPARPREPWRFSDDDSALLLASAALAGSPHALAAAREVLALDARAAMAAAPVVEGRLRSAGAGVRAVDSAVVALVCSERRFAVSLLPWLQDSVASDFAVAYCLCPEGSAVTSASRAAAFICDALRAASLAPVNLRSSPDAACAALLKRYGVDGPLREVNILELALGAGAPRTAAALVEDDEIALSAADVVAEHAGDADACPNVMRVLVDCAVESAWSADKERANEVLVAVLNAALSQGNVGAAGSAISRLELGAAATASTVGIAFPRIVKSGRGDVACQEWAASVVRTYVAQRRFEAVKGSFESAVSVRWFRLATALGEVEELQPQENAARVLLAARAVSESQGSRDAVAEAEAFFRKIVASCRLDLERIVSCGQQLAAFCEYHSVSRVQREGYEPPDSVDLCLVFLQSYHRDLRGAPESEKLLVSTRDSCRECTAFLVCSCGAPLDVCGLPNPPDLLTAEFAVRLGEFSAACDKLIGVKDTRPMQRFLDCEEHVFWRSVRSCRDGYSCVLFLRLLQTRELMPQFPCPFVEGEVGVAVRFCRAFAPVAELFIQTARPAEPWPYLLHFPSLLRTALSLGMQTRSEDGETSLMAIAIEERFVDAVRVLLEPYEIIEALIHWEQWARRLRLELLEEEEGATLWAAIRYGDTEEAERCVRFLCECGVEPDIPHAELGYTPLHYCITNGKKELAIALIECHANPDAFMGKNTAILDAAGVSEDVVVRLLDVGASVDWYTSQPEMTLLSKCLSNCMWRAAEKLIAAGADGSTKDAALGRTALHWAAANDAPEGIVRGLLSTSNVVNACDNAQRSALSLCKGFVQSALMVVAGADVGAVSFGQAELTPDKLGALLCLSKQARALATAKNLEGVSGEHLEPIAALMCCAIAAPEALTRALLLVSMYGKDQRSRPWWLPLHIAAATGNHELVSAILDQGIWFADDLDALGATPLHYAVMHSEAQCARLLLPRLRTKGMIEQVLSASSKLGRPALEMALDQEQPDVVVDLLDAGLTPRSLITAGFGTQACCDRVCEALLSRIRSECTPESKFTDPVFLPNDSSLWRFPSRVPKGVGVPSEWRRVSDETTAVLFQDDSPAAGQARQGDIDSGSLLVALTLASQVDNGRLVREKLFYPVGPADAAIGVYAVRLYTVPRARPTFVIVDDHVPFKKCRRGGGDREAALQPLYAHARARDQWYVALVEKAFAKAKGSYEMAIGGSVGEAMQCLVGGCVSTIDLTSPDTLREIRNGSLWQTLGRIRSDPCKDVDEHGLVPGHSYGIAGLVTLARKYHLVKLYTPHNGEKWTGDWSEGSAHWVAYQKTSAGGAASDGLPGAGFFYMDFESDFLRLFSAIVTCSVRREASKSLLRQVFSEEVYCTPSHVVAVRLPAPSSLHVDVTQLMGYSCRDSSDEIQILLGSFPLDVFDVSADDSGSGGGGSALVTVHEYHPIDAVARHMEVLADSRPLFCGSVSLEAAVPADRLEAAGGTVFVVVFWRKKTLDSFGKYTLAVSVESEGGARCGDVSVVPVRFTPNARTAFERIAMPGVQSQAVARGTTGQLELAQLAEKVRGLEAALAAKEEEIAAAKAEGRPPRAPKAAKPRAAAARPSSSSQPRKGSLLAAPKSKLRLRRGPKSQEQRAQQPTRAASVPLRARPPSRSGPGSSDESRPQTASDKAELRSSLRGLLAVSAGEDSPEGSPDNARKHREQLKAPLPKFARRRTPGEPGAKPIGKKSPTVLNFPISKPFVLPPRPASACARPAASLSKASCAAAPGDAKASQ